MNTNFASTDVERHPWPGAVISLVGLLLFLFPGVTYKFGKKWRAACHREQSQLGYSYTRVTGILILLVGMGVIYLELNK